MGPCICFKLLFIVGLWIPVEKVFTKYQKLAYNALKNFIIFSVFLLLVLEIITLIIVDDIQDFNEIFATVCWFFVVWIKMFFFDY